MDETHLAAAMMETVSLPLLALDDALRVEAVNPAFLRLFQVTREETVGRRLYDLGNGQWDLAELRHLLEDILPSRTAIEGYRVEHVFDHIGRRIMSFNARRIRMADGRDRILIAICDETEREGLIAELRAQSEFAGKIFDSVREALLILHADLRVQSANEVFFELFEVNREETIGRPLHELGNGQWDIPDLRRQLEEVLPRQTSFNDFVVDHVFDGLGRRVMMLNGRRLDHVDYIILAIRDVTALRESQDRLLTLTHGARVGVFDADLRAGTLYWSPEARAILGWPEGAEPPPPGTIPPFIHPDDAASVQAELDRAMDPSDSGSFHHEHRIIRPAGDVRWLEISGEVQFSSEEGGRVPLRIRGIILDATERHQTDAKLKESEARQGFLLSLQDTIRILKDPDEIKETASRLLGEHMKVSRAVYTENVDGTWAQASGEFLRDVHPLAARVPIAGDGAHAAACAQQGEALIVDDILEDDRFSDAERDAWVRAGARATLSVGLLEDDRCVATFGVHATEPRRWTIEEVRRARETADRVFEAVGRARAETALRRSEERQKRVLESQTVGVIFFDTEGHVRDCNDAFLAMVGHERSEIEGGRLTLRTLTPPDWLEAHRAKIAALAHAERIPPFEREYLTAEGGRIWLLVAGQRVEPDLFVQFCIDVSDRKRAEAHRDLLMREVNHRAKNMLSIVQAIARATAGGDPADFVSQFQKRVQALAASQDLIISGRWEGVALDELMRKQLAHFEGLIDTRIVLSGPMTILTAAAAQSIGMVVHELTTNAGKYGALSSEAGRVDIAWEVGEGPAGQSRFRMSWRESGGPPVRPPTRTGFGSRVLCDMARMNLGASVELDYRAEGLVWRIDCPAERSVLAAGGRERLAPIAPDEALPVEAGVSHGGRILIVEDEAFLALDLTDELTHAGFEVVGPAGSVAQALRLLNEGGCDAAVLDANLGGETAEAIADALKSRHIPFLVLSGYSGRQLPERLRSAPRLSKPVHLPALLETLERVRAPSAGR